jgi:sugar/nucleoside kinase (ribokinase family)
MKFVTAGGLRCDYLITPDGEAQVGMVGGNAVYAAVGAALWSDAVGLWARLGENYPLAWLAALAELGLDSAGLTRIAGHQDHRTFFAYTADGRREDTNPAAHFARINQPLPAELAGYTYSTLGQDDPTQYEPLALRPGDWPAAYTGVTAVHLSPLSICTHRDVAPFLRQRGIGQVTADPGERYMVPKLLPHIRQILPHLDAFLPSAQETRSLFGAQTTLSEAAATLAEWGTPLVVVKNGAAGVLVYERANGRLTDLSAYHAPGDSRVVDITGAGDSFCGGFMVGLAQSRDPILAAQMGLVSASLVIEGYGALYALRQPNAEATRRLDELRQATKT